MATTFHCNDTIESEKIFMIGHKGFESKFKPSGRGGGSKKGKPQSYWPYVLQMISRAVYVSFHGSPEAFQADRREPPAYRASMVKLVPDIVDWCKENMPNRSTPSLSLLSNRTRKQIGYAGRSARGNNHDPRTRATLSTEDLSYKVPTNHRLWRLYDQNCERGNTYSSRLEEVSWRRCAN